MIHKLQIMFSTTFHNSYIKRYLINLCHTLFMIRNKCVSCSFEPSYLKWTFRMVIWDPYLSKANRSKVYSCTAFPSPLLYYLAQPTIKTTNSCAKLNMDLHVVNCSLLLRTICTVPTASKHTRCGTVALMLGFPCLQHYCWIDGAWQHPSSLHLAGALCLTWRPHSWCPW